MLYPSITLLTFQADHGFNRRPHRKGPAGAITLRRPLLVVALLLTSLCAAFGQTGLANLQTEYLTEPLGLETATPRFRWNMTTADHRRGARQVAYHLVVKDERGSTVWNSGKVNSATSLNVTYAGQPLQPRTRYDWTVEIEAEDGSVARASSWFETALTLGQDAEDAWNDAQWIGGDDEDLILYSPYLSVFRLAYTLQLEAAAGITRPAFLFGGNDARFQDKNKNLFGVQTGRDESYLAIELDPSTLHEDGQARVHLYRAGYAPDDQAGKPLYSFVVPEDLLNPDNLYEPHRFELELVFGQGNLYLDGQTTDHQLNDTPLNLNPFGQGGDFISAPMVGEVGFRVPAGGTAHFTNVLIRNYRQPANVLARIPDQKIVATDTPFFSLADPSKNGAPLLRTEFTTAEQAVAKARLYVTARGIYEIFLNGKRVGQDYFNPGLTQYNKSHMYQTYDVTADVRQGADNVLGAWLGEGWWSGGLTFTGSNWNYFGDRQSLLAQLIITYADGSERIIKTNDQDWELFTGGPIRYGSFFQGEVYDARREDQLAGWQAPGFAAPGWKPAVVVPLEGTSVTGTFRNFIGQPLSLSYDNFRLKSQPGTEVRAIDTLVPQSSEEVRPGVYVYDMGQNMVGVPQVVLENTQAGDTIVLRYAEVRYPELPDYAGNENMIMLENIRAALTQDIYITKGGAREVIQPRFTFHGFRFLEITGIAGARPLDAVKGIVLSSVEALSSSYETSNPLVNRFWENITWSLRGNFLSIPTDTPARNERMGWNGDINVFSRAATWLADINPFLNRHALAIRDMQAASGRFSDVAPVGNGFGGTIWGSAGIIVPWENYRQFGDLDALASHYPAMQRYVAFLDTRFENGLLMEGPLGDWLSPENGKNDNTLLWGAYYGYNLRILAQAAAELGKAAEARDYGRRFDEFRQAFNDRYVDPATGKMIDQGVRFSFGRGVTVDSTLSGKPVDTQAAYAIPLAFGLISEENKAKVASRLAATIERANVDDGGVTRPPYSLMTGFIGTASISNALSATGREDLAYRMLQQEAYPSWLYPVKNGATTIWERLNSYTHTDGFGGNNSMNSFNHYSFGAVASWMYEHSLGIQRDPAVPGFQHFHLAPTPDPTQRMTFARGHYDSPYGRIESSWTATDTEITYTFVVPAGATATLRLPAPAKARIKESGKAVRKAKGVTSEGWQDGRALFTLGAGAYRFTVPVP